MSRKVMIVVATILILATTACAAGTPETAAVTRIVPQTVEVTRVVSEIVEVTREVPQTVEVTRVSTQVVTATPPPATPSPALPLTDVPGSRDFSIIPRPPSPSCVITFYNLYKYSAELRYACDPDSMEPSELADHYVETMPSNGWVLESSRQSEGAWRLLYSVSTTAPAEQKEMIRSVLIVAGDDGEVAMYVETNAPVTTEDWEPFLAP